MTRIYSVFLSLCSRSKSEGCSRKAFDIAALHGYTNGMLLRHMVLIDLEFLIQMLHLLCVFISIHSVLDILLEHRAPFSVAAYEGAASAGHIDVVCVYIGIRRIMAFAIF